MTAMYSISQANSNDYGTVTRMTKAGSCVAVCCIGGWISASLTTRNISIHKYLPSSVYSECHHTA